MKKITILIVLASQMATAQVSHNRVFLGVNESSIGYDYSMIGANVQTFSKFSNGKIGLNVGYIYEQKIVKSLFVSAGLEFKTLNNAITRPHFYNDPILRTGVINEDLHFSRLQVPLLLKYKFPSKTKNQFYLYAGSGIILVNRVKREASYSISFPAGDSVTNIELKQKAMFGKNSSLGSTIIFGTGYDFKIKKNSFSIELGFAGDISKTRITTFENIENNSYYFTKFKSIEFKVAYCF